MLNRGIVRLTKLPKVRHSVKAEFSFTLAWRTHFETGVTICVWPSPWKKVLCCAQASILLSIDLRLGCLMLWAGGVQWPAQRRIDSALKMQRGSNHTINLCVLSIPIRVGWFLIWAIAGDVNWQSQDSLVQLSRLDEIGAQESGM